MNKTNIIAEIGINHNGSIDICKKLISISAAAGCDYVKIQKRNPDLCVPEHQKNIIKETPWGKITYINYKKRIEFDEKQLVDLVNYSNSLNIKFFASVWDKDSAEAIKNYTNIVKIPSACITDLDLCRYVRSNFDKLIISTGMSTEEEISVCVESCMPDVIMHTNSTYPCNVEELNLNYILWLKQKYPLIEIGYSGHEYGLVTTFAAKAIGASWIERHVTLDHNMWGSDQKSSLEPTAIFKLVKGIRDIDKATQYKPQERILFENEKIKKDVLRKVK